MDYGNRNSQQTAYPEYADGGGDEWSDYGQESHSAAAAPAAGRKFESTHFYCGKAALCVSADETRDHFHTVRLEMASAQGQRKYNWKDKISIQVTKGELPVIMAFMLGILPSVSYKSHGPQKNKGFRIERPEGQQGKILFSVFEGQVGSRMVPVLPDQQFSLSAMLLEAMLRNHPLLTDVGVISLVKSLAPSLAQISFAETPRQGGNGYGGGYGGGLQ